MPWANKNQRQQAYRENERHLKILFQAVVMPMFRFSKTLILAKRIKEYEYTQNIILDGFGLGFLFAALMMLGSLSLFGHRLYIFWYVAGIFAGILLISFIVFLFRKRVLSSPFSSDHKSIDYISVTMSTHLTEALKIMDSTAKYYNDENEANRELVSTLKAMNITASYQFPLPNGRIADAKIPNALVEGKLSPNTREVDGLLGQIIDYTQFGDKLYIVIYGKLDDNAKRRIEKEISLRYPQQVFLTNLPNPRRRRIENNFGATLSY